jgi:hypothetical protein
LTSELHGDTFVESLSVPFPAIPMDPADPTQQRAEPNRAIRLLIEYDKSGFSITDSRPLETLAPASHALDAPRATSGFWVELRDAKKNVLYRRVMPNPVQSDVEIFDPEGLHRHAVEEPKGVFTVLVPDIPDAEEIAFVSSPPDPAKRQNAAREVAAMPLRRRRRKRG